MGVFSIVEYFNNLKHDVDSCLDVWEDFYKEVYPKFFGKYFDFSNIQDVETSSNGIYLFLKKISTSI